MRRSAMQRRYDNLWVRSSPAAAVRGVPGNIDGRMARTPTVGGLWLLNAPKST